MKSQKSVVVFLFIFITVIFSFIHTSLLSKFQMKNQIRTYEPFSFHMMIHSHDNMILPCKTKIFNEDLHIAVFFNLLYFEKKNQNQIPQTEKLTITVNKIKKENQS